MSLTTVDGSLISSGAITLTTQVTGTLPVANGGSGVTTSTGTGAVVLGTSPTLVTPILGTPTSGNLANCTGIPAPAALSTASGSAPSYSARAWVNFDGTLASPITPRASGNISSVTKSSTALYTINFTTAMPDANYSIVGAGGFHGASAANSTMITANPINTTSCFIGTRNGVNADSSYSSVSVSIFR